MSRALPDARLRTARLTMLVTLWFLISGAGQMLAFEPLWVALYPGGPSGAAIAVDRLGNTYVTGGEKWSGESSATIKYDPEGNQVWAAWCRLGSRGPGWLAVGLDSADAVYVAGTVRQEPVGLDYVVVKYRPTGEQGWVARYDHNRGEPYYADDAKAACIDPAGNVYVTGSSYNAGTEHDCATVKFNSSGTLLWSARWDGGLYRSDAGRAITTDQQGNVYVTGIAAGEHPLALKYSPDGDLLWVAVDSASGSSDAVAVDPAGNVYSFGTIGTDGWMSYYLTKHDSIGRKLWDAIYDGGGDDASYAMVLDDSAGIYVTGLSDGPGTGWDICTVKWDSAGNRCWVARYDQSGWGDIGEDLATDGKYVYTVGSCTDSFPLVNMCLVTIDAVSGSILWASPFRYPGAARGGATAVAVGPDGCALATGGCDAGTLTLTYTPSGTGVVSEPGEKPETGLGVVPSLFRGWTRIRYQALRAGRVRVTVLDVAGREVAALLDADVPAGQGEVTWQAQGLASGVYFLKLETPDGSFSERVLLVR